MKIIAHRGLLEGPNKKLENTLETIKKSLSLGFDVEIDVWYKNGWFLGHDYPQYPIEFNFLRNKKFWIHAKNIPAIEQLTRNKREFDSNLNFFWHENDAVTLTSQNFIWTYPGQNLTSYSICVLPENYMLIENTYAIDCYGICTDFPMVIKEMCEQEYILKKYND